MCVFFSKRQGAQQKDLGGSCGAGGTTSNGHIDQCQTLLASACSFGLGVEASGLQVWFHRLSLTNLGSGAARVSIVSSFRVLPLDASAVDLNALMLCCFNHYISLRLAVGYKCYYFWVKCLRFAGSSIGERCC